MRQSLDNAQLSKEDRIAVQFYIGYELFKKKEFDKAQKAFDKVIKARKGNYAYAAFYVGCAKIIQGKYDEAHEYFLKVRKEDSLEPYLPYYLALTHYARRDYDQVIKYYADRLKESSILEKESLRRLVAWSYYHQDSWADAAKTFQPLYSAEALSDEEVIVLAQAYSRSGNHPRAISLLSKMQVKPKPSLENRISYELASSLSMAGRSQDAIQIFTDLLKKNSLWDQDIKWNLAILHFRVGQYDESAKLAGQLLKSRLYAQAEGLLGDLYKHHLNPDQKEEMVTNVMKGGQDLDFINQDVYLQAIAHVKNRQFDKANVLFSQLERQGINEEQRTTLMLWKGIVYYHQKNYEKSASLLETGLRKNLVEHTKLNLDARYILSYLRFKQKDHEAALGHFSKAYAQLSIPELHLSPGQIQGLQEDILLRIGDIYFIGGRYNDSQLSYEKAAALKGTKKDHSLYQRAIIADLKDKPYDQLLLLEELIDEHPNSKYAVRANFATANTYFTLGKLDKATRIYQSLLRNTNNDEIAESSLIQLGLISVNAGDFSQAESYYASLLERSKDPVRRKMAENSLKEIYSDYTHDTDQYLDLASTDAQEGTNQPKDELLYQLAMKNLGSNRADQARGQFQKLISEYQNSDYTDQSTYELLKLSLQGGDYASSAKYLTRLLEKNSGLTSEKELSQWTNDIFQNSIKGREWNTVIELLKYERLNALVSTSPRLTYYAAVSEFNNDRLDESANRIIDHYELLLKDPAWLAKSIILLADVHFLQGDTASATAALKALLETDQKIPSSLIEQARKRLQTFEL